MSSEVAGARGGRVSAQLSLLSTGSPVVWLVVAVVLVALPFVIKATLPSFYVALAAEMLIMGLFAMGFDILMGYTGMISFGHAAFLGLGAYGTAILIAKFGLPVPLAFAGGVLTAALAAAIIGFFSIRVKSVYFALLTFAFAQIFYQISVVWQPITAGYDGLSASFSFAPGIPGLFEWNLADHQSLYYFVLLVVALTFVLMRRIVASPFGTVLQTIKENETRASCLGYDVSRYKQVAFLISGTLGGLAGALLLLHQKFVSPDLLHWRYSGDVIVMVLLGGMGTLYGPMIGAALVVFLSDLVTQFTKYWLLVLGLVFIAIVILAPQGLVGLLRPPRRSAAGPVLEEPPPELEPIVGHSE